MVDVFIPLADLVYAAKHPLNPNKLNILFNDDLFSPHVIKLLKLENVRLFILVNETAAHPDQYTLYAPRGKKVTLAWQVLEPMITASLSNFFDVKIPFTRSIDLDHDMSFLPKERKWQNEIHADKILLTYITPEPNRTTLESHGVKHFRLLSSYISALDFKNAMEKINSIKETLPNKLALVIADNDETLLSYRLSYLKWTVEPNEQVIEVIQEFQETLESAKAKVAILSMTARDKAAEEESTKCNHPLVIKNVAELVRKRNVPILLNDILSYSYPVHSKDRPGQTKTRKLAHVLKLKEKELELLERKENQPLEMEELEFLKAVELLDLKDGVILIIDDCRFELDPNFIEDMRDRLLKEFECRLVIVPVSLLGYDDPVGLRDLLKKKQAEEKVSAQMGKLGLFDHALSGVVTRGTESTHQTDPAGSCTP